MRRIINSIILLLLLFSLVIVLASCADKKESADSKSCEVCDGTGIAWDINKGIYDRCKNCKGTGRVASKSSTTSHSSNSSSNNSSSNSSSSGRPSSSAFTNLYGTPTTVCAHKGCTNYIASTGDTNCCTVHSRKCLECGKYIDEDATWCMSCISKAANSSGSSSKSSSSSSSKGPWHSSNVNNDGMGPYYCYGKNNTCTNKTYNCYDLYCDSCDPDGDNKEG